MKLNKEKLGKIVDCLNDMAGACGYQHLVIHAANPYDLAAAQMCTFCQFLS